MPDGFHAVTPYLTVRDAERALDFYKRAFGARERVRMPMPDGKIAHAELQIGNSTTMLGVECAEHGKRVAGNARRFPGRSGLVRGECGRHIQTRRGCGSFCERAGPRQVLGRPGGSVTDPFGHRWMLLTHIEDVSPVEIKSGWQKPLRWPGRRNTMRELVSGASHALSTSEDVGDIKRRSKLAGWVAGIAGVAFGGAPAVGETIASVEREPATTNYTFRAIILYPKVTLCVNSYDRPLSVLEA